MEVTSLAEKIYAAVRLIPRGKVASYSQIAALAGNRNLRRYVGNALHKNPSNSFTPCHRVVNAKGYCSGSFAFGGSSAQQEKLEAEGLVFKDGHVDMKKYAISQDDFELMRLQLEDELTKVRKPGNAAKID
ncbi:MAG: MGMT family protein [Treponema sp.]|nr:MGMT family protein [Treponema sp.]